MKPILEISPSCHDLPDIGLTAWHITIGLQEPATHHMPFPALNLVFDPEKKFRVILFNPFIQNSFIMIEDETVVFLTQFHGCPESGKCFGGAFFPLP
jgi:hypothetical protein